MDVVLITATLDLPMPQGSTANIATLTDQKITSL